MDQDDLPPAKDTSEPETFGSALGLTFAGAMWVALFAVIAGLMLYGVMHWL
jgi:hypothetical protein